MNKNLCALLCTASLLLSLLAGCGQGGGTESGKAGAFSAVIQGQTVTCDTDAAPCLAAFGDGYEYSEAISCAYDGMDKIYMYPDFNLYTYPQGEKDFVSEIEFLSESCTTGKGVHIGSTRDEVLAAYGESYETEGILTVYYEGDTGASASVYFIFADGVVTDLGITGKAAREG